MKTIRLARLFSLALLTSAAVLSPSAMAQTSNTPPLRISWYYPTNGQVYVGPTNVGLHAYAVDSNVVRTVAYFSGATLISTVTNTSSSNSFFYNWTSVGLGAYTLTAVGTDTAGNVATSAPVTITVQSPPPPPPPHPSVYIYSPTNNSVFLIPTNVSIYARAVESSNAIQQVQFFSGTSSLGIVTNSTVYSNISSEPLYELTWTNPLPGNYPLTAVAMDSQGITATSQVVNISIVTNLPPPTPVVYIYSPTNNSKFIAPANVGIYAHALETGGAIGSVQFFAGANSLGTVTNTGIYSNISSVPLYELTWSNAPLGNFALTAVATDTNGLMATSQVVNISVVTNTPPPPVPFVVGWYYPTNGQTFTAPASVGLHASVTDSNVVRTMQYFANSALVATVTNTNNVVYTNSSTGNPFFYGWSNVAAGTYVLTAVATDVAGATATSGPITIYVIAPTNRPPVVRITSPPNAASFRSPVNIPIYAYAYDPDGLVTGVEFFAGTTDLGPGNRVPHGTNVPPTSDYSNYFSIIWSNAPVGTWPLTAQATDNSNAVTISPIINITILPPVTPPTNPIPIVAISAIDPVAIEGTNCWVWPGMSNAVPNWSNWIGRTVVPFTNCGPKNATFQVYHSGDTNTPLTITYSIGGTASNGVDYVTLPGTVTIPAGQRTAMISIVPLDDGPPDTNSTVIVRLTPSTTLPPAYTLYSRSAAEAVILDGTPTAPAPTATASVLPDQTFHLNASGPNGAWFRVEASTDMQTWTPICTNQVVNGSIDFADPNASNSASQYYRAVPEANAPQ